MQWDSSDVFSVVEEEEEEVPATRVLDPAEKEKSYLNKEWS